MESKQIITVTILGRSVKEEWVEKSLLKFPSLQCVSHVSITRLLVKNKNLIEIYFFIRYFLIMKIQIRHIIIIFKNKFSLSLELFINNHHTTYYYFLFFIWFKKSWFRLYIYFGSVTNCKLFQSFNPTFLAF